MKKKLVCVCCLIAITMGIVVSLVKSSPLNRVFNANVDALVQGDGPSCTATAFCGDYGTISCTGFRLCLTGHEYVECDGVKSYCAI